MNPAQDTAGDPFVWPPRREPPHSEHEQDREADAPHWLDAQWPREAGRVAQAIGEVERVLLGGGSDTLERRADQTGWRPEHIARACWRCAGSVGEHEVGDDGCAACRASRPPWNRFVRLGVHEFPIREAIHDLKFHARRGVGRELGRLLGLRIRYEMQRTGQPTHGVIVPMPISARRRLRRGVDHTLVLARAASAECGLPVRRLLRRSHRPSQLSVPPSEREANVRGSIRARKGAQAPGEGVVIVLDDVRTTGATMRAACRAVEALGVERGRLWACVAGVRDAPERRRGVEAQEAPEMGP